MRDIFKEIETRKILLSDGGMGSFLFSMGLKSGDCPEALNLSKPELLESIAAQYLSAGADIIQTNTFGGSPLKLMDYGLDKRTEEINISAVKAVLNACGDRAFVSGSCGPSGRTLLPYGDTEPEVILASYKRQVKALMDSGVDLICIETMVDIHEAKLAIEAVRAFSEYIPVIATMTFDQTPAGFYTIMGVNIEQACRELEKAGANIVGSNCGNGLDMMVRIAVEFCNRTSLPVIIQSNAGIPVKKGDKTVYNESPEFFEKNIHKLLQYDVSIVGGCCGTTPEHIKRIRKVMNSMAQQAF